VAPAAERARAELEDRLEAERCAHREGMTDAARKTPWRGGGAYEGWFADAIEIVTIHATKIVRDASPCRIAQQRFFLGKNTTGNILGMFAGSQ